MSSLGLTTVAVWGPEKELEWTSVGRSPGNTGTPRRLAPVRLNTRFFPGLEPSPALPLRSPCEHDRGGIVGLLVCVAAACFLRDDDVSRIKENCGASRCLDLFSRNDGEPCRAPRTDGTRWELAAWGLAADVRVAARLAVLSSGTRHGFVCASSPALRTRGSGLGAGLSKTRSISMSASLFWRPGESLDIREVYFTFGCVCNAPEDGMVGVLLWWGSGRARWGRCGADALGGAARGIRRDSGVCATRMQETGWQAGTKRVICLSGA